MLYKKLIKTWCSDGILLQVEDRYKDSGEIIIQIDDEMDAATASLILEDVKTLRDELDKIISICEKQ